MNWNEHLKTTGLLLTTLMVAACSRPEGSGQMHLTVIQPIVGQSCQYQVAEAPVNTLDSLQELRGLVGQVVYHPKSLDSDSDFLDLGVGFKNIDLRVSGSNGHYAPQNMDSLFAMSLYYAMERGYTLFKDLDPSADMSKIVPNLRDTKMIHDARASLDEYEYNEASDNAAYVAYPSSTGETKNYFISFPTETIKDIPLGLNLGVMIHEYTHMVVQHLFHKNRSKTGSSSRETNNTINALDEGLADYFGFLATKDAGFFHCSFPNLDDRNLAHKKVMDAPHYQRLLDSDYDSHEGGAVWASVQYQIGEEIGHEANARSLITFMQNLATCSGVNDAGARVTFKKMASCHLAALGSRSSKAAAIYESTFSAVRN